MKTIDILGYFAGVLTTIAFLPQAIKAFRTRSTKDTSLAMCLMLSTGILCWLIYGIVLRAGPIIVANIVSFFLVAAILVLKIRNG